jgi:glyoxylase-like metal-dependent hydrolase (beta-lactamase superfamily II)
MKKNITAILISIIVLLTTGCAKTKEYQVFAVKFCNGWKIEARDVVIGSSPSDSVDVCNMFWLIKGSGKRNILVDAGYIDTTYSNKNYIRPDSMLQKLGISPSEITDIILTHPHFDHISGIILFPEAEVWMQQDDYDYFIGPAWQENGDNRGFEKKDVENLLSVNSRGKLKLIKGDNINIFPGIKAYTGSKHTFENQYLVVNSNSRKNKILLASDAIWFYLNQEKHLPASICMDTAAYVQAIRRMDSLVTNRDLIIPGHDNTLFSKFPEIQNRIVEIKE